MKPGESINISIAEVDNGYRVHVQYLTDPVRQDDDKVFITTPEVHDFVRNVMNLNFPPRDPPQDESSAPTAAPDPHQSLGQ